MALALRRFALLFLLLSLLAMMVYGLPTAFRQDDDDDGHEEKSPEASKDEDDEDEVCVDASYLSKFQSHHLVHTEHLVSDVFCPKGQYASLPCATGDHMLRMAGVSLSYREFCESHKCDNKRMPVNSVLSHVWEEESHGNVVLTMFDSRHPEVFQKAIHRLTSLRRSVVGALF